MSKRLEIILNCFLVTICVFVLIAPGGPADSWIGNRRQAALERELIERHWPELAVETPTLTGSGPIKAIMYIDYECPFCREDHKAFKEAFEKAGTQVAIGLRHLPLSRIHSNARRGAEIAACADDIGRLAEAHDYLLTNETWRTNEGYLEDLPFVHSATEERAFLTCVHGGRADDIIRRDSTLARQLGIQSTPTIISRENILRGALGVEAWLELISN